MSSTFSPVPVVRTSDSVVYVAADNNNNVNLMFLVVMVVASLIAVFIAFMVMRRHARSFKTFWYLPGFGLALALGIVGTAHSGLSRYSQMDSSHVYTQQGDAVSKASQLGAHNPMAMAKKRSEVKNVSECENIYCS